MVTKVLRIWKAVADLNPGDGFFIGCDIMEFQGIEYSVVQGIERGTSKWSASVAGVFIMEEEPTRAAAVAAAENAIKRAFAGKRIR